MNIIIIIFILLVILFLLKTTDNFISINNFRVFDYGNINNNSDYKYRNQNNHDYLTFFKLGEINVDSGPYKNYDKYINALHNSRMGYSDSFYNNLMRYYDDIDILE